MEGERNGNSSNQQKVRGLNNISKVIGLVKDKDLTPNPFPRLERDNARDIEKTLPVIGAKR